MLAPIRDWLAMRVPWLQTASPEHFGYRAMQPLSPDSSAPFSAGSDRYNHSSPLLRSDGDRFDRPSDLTLTLGCVACTPRSLSHTNKL